MKQLIKNLYFQTGFTNPSEVLFLYSGNGITIYAGSHA